VAEKQAIAGMLENKIRALAKSLEYTDTPLLSPGTHNIELCFKNGVSNEYVYIERFTGISKRELQIVISPKLDGTKANKITEISNIRSGQEGSKNGKAVKSTQHSGFGNKLPSGNYIGRAWRVPINETLVELENFLKVLLDEGAKSDVSLPKEQSDSSHPEENQEDNKIQYTDFGEAPDDDPNELNTFARKVRKGQAAFREKLVALYGGKCAITGSSPLAVLEASHIFNHSELGINHSDNGLLLRADIHLLFDDGLLKINPDTLLIELSNTLKGTQYWDLNGVKLRDRIDGSSPSKEYLIKKWYSPRKLG
jgi:hypothetical protein